MEDIDILSVSKFGELFLFNVFFGGLLKALKGFKKIKIKKKLKKKKIPSSNIMIVDQRAYRSSI